MSIFLPASLCDIRDIFIVLWPTCLILAILLIAYFIEYWFLGLLLICIPSGLIIMFFVLEKYYDIV